MTDRYLLNIEEIGGDGVRCGLCHDTEGDLVDGKRQDPLSGETEGKYHRECIAEFGEQLAETDKYGRRSRVGDTGGRVGMVAILASMALVLAIDGAVCLAHHFGPERSSGYTTEDRIAVEQVKAENFRRYKAERETFGSRNLERLSEDMTENR